MGASLVQAPSQRDLNAYYCPRVLREHGLGAGADLACGAAFGSPPAEQAMQVAFDLRFNVANPNQIPLPLSEILTAITAFPNAANQALGAVCLRLCAPGDARCRGGADPTACRSAPGDIRTLNDFPQALANFLVAEGVAAASGQPVGFTAPQVLAGSSLDVTARLALVPEGLLPVLEQLARQSFDQLRAGQRVTFAIPYQLQGTVFGDAGSLGRVAAGFGPVAGDWALPM